MKNDTYAQYGANLDDSIAYQAYHATTSYEVTDQV
jgi:stage II sporulation protein D